MDFQPVQLSPWLVEVSGWDVDENFFVEKAMLNYAGDETRISLGCALRDGCVVFVRLLESATVNNFPIAYQAKHVSARGAKGRSRVSLTPMHPQPMRAHNNFELPGSMLLA